MMHPRYLLATLLVVAACGGDDGGTPVNPMPDAPPAATCLPTAGEITSYPGTFSGTILGGGADLSAAEGSCATQTGDLWFDPVSEDVVIRLGGLTAGKTYVVSLTTDEDLSFYVTAACPAMAGAVTGCLNFTDESLSNEQGTFVASGTEHFLIVDAPEAPTTGAFTVDIVAAECTAATEATDCSAPTPLCVDFACVQCASSFDCAAGAPVCDATGTCAVGPTTCTNDTDDTASPNDGPSAATMIATPTAVTPTVVTGGVCNSPTSEQDWYKVTLAAGSVGVSLNFTGSTNDLDVYLVDASGAVVARGESNAGINEAIRGDGLTAGMYYVVVTQYKPDATTAAVPYTLTVSIPACANDFGCTVATAPVCNGAGTCVGGFTGCTGDDAGDNGAGGDDGPAAARALTANVGVAATLTGSVCSSPSKEADWYKVTSLVGEGLDVSVTWTGADDLDPIVLDSTGRTVGLSYYKANAENVKLTYLPAGTYYIKVSKFTGMTASAVVTPYTVSATRTTAQACVNSASCAAEFSTQVYRGSCTAGACQFITTTGGANNTACDSSGDCTSGSCSYISFESDAQDSVCTDACTTTADCAVIGSGLTCNSGSGLCVPSCTTDLECGADTGSDVLTTGQPWDYLTCTVGTGECAL